MIAGDFYRARNIGDNFSWQNRKSRRGGEWLPLGWMKLAAYFPVWEVLSLKFRKTWKILRILAFNEQSKWSSSSQLFSVSISSTRILTKIWVSFKEQDPWPLNHFSFRYQIWSVPFAYTIYTQHCLLLLWLFHPF